MKSLVISDLHQEFTSIPPDYPKVETSFDLVILAGDIHRSPTAAMQWARHMFPDHPILLVAGNHEFYNCDIDREYDAAQKSAATHGVHFLQMNAITIGNVRFLGTTLWTDFCIFENRNLRQKTAFHIAELLLPDFKIIKNGLRIFSPSDAYRRHLAERAWLHQQLLTPFDGKTVVITHHGPHLRSVERQYMKSRLTPAFVSHMPEFFEQPWSPDLWIHGHVHSSHDYLVGRTRVIVNPSGYFDFGRWENPRFQHDLIIEI